MGTVEPYTCNRARVQILLDTPLNALKNLLLELPLDLLALVIGTRLAVESQKSPQIEFGGLEELDLANVDLIHGQIGCNDTKGKRSHERFAGDRCPGWISRFRGR